MNIDDIEENPWEEVSKKIIDLAAKLEEDVTDLSPPRKKFKATSTAPSGKLLEAVSNPATKLKGAIVNIPTQEMTGVSETLTTICASLSAQLYQAKSESDFKLGTNVEVLKFENHEEWLESVVPPFAICKTGDTMIMGWRGSSTIMDWTADFNASPVMSNASRGVRIQSSFLSLVESDFYQYGSYIVDRIRKLRVKEVIFTGHSLGGAVAQVAHHVVVAQRMSRETSIWDAISSRVTIRSLTFSAPMSITPDPNNKDRTVQNVLDRVGLTACNVVYSFDPVPRSYRMILFGLDLANAVVNSLGWKQKTTKWFLERFLPKSLRSLKEAEIEAKIKAHIGFTSRFRHIGQIVYYNDADSEPQLLTDTPGASNLRAFQSIKVPTNMKISVENVAAAHNFLVRGPGLASPGLENE